MNRVNKRGTCILGVEAVLRFSNWMTGQCVLSDGTIVNTTADNAHGDLFWAMHGGGNSFCIVTAFEIKTLSYPAVTVGMVAFTPGPEGTPETMRKQWLDSVYAFAVNGSNDPKAHIEPLATWSTSSGFSWTCYVFYNGNVRILLTIVLIFFKKRKRKTLSICSPSSG